MPAAARVGDLHSCPNVPAGNVIVSQPDGTITGPGAPTVLIGGQPAARIGDLCGCPQGAPEPIAVGSSTVLIGGRPAARVGDKTQQGSIIRNGFPTVIIGG